MEIANATAMDDEMVGRKLFSSQFHDIKKRWLLLYIILLLTCIPIAAQETQQAGANDLDPITQQAIDGRSGIPLAHADLFITTENKSIYRENNVVLNITIRNNELSNPLLVQYIRIDLLPIYNVANVNSESCDGGSFQNRIRISSFNVEKNGQKSFKYTVHIPKNTIANNKSSLISHEEFNNTEIDNIISIKRHRIERNKIHLNDIIDIQDNIPRIDSARVSLASNQMLPLENAVFINGNISYPLRVFFDITAEDIEDGKNLKYASIVSRSFGSERKNETLTEEFIPTGYFSRNISLKRGEVYTFFALVKDSQNQIAEIPAYIRVNGENYTSIIVPNAPFFEGSIFVIIFVFTLVMTIVIHRSLKRYRSCKQTIINRNRAIKMLFFTWMIYIILLHFSYFKLYSTIYVFFNTFPLFELVIYISIFIIISYFIEACFSLDDMTSFYTKALWINYFSTLFLLMIFIFIFPSITKISSDLNVFYAAVTTILGTVFALIVTLSSQFPRNIFTVDRCVNMNMNYFSYPTKLFYFVILYGAVLGISLLGLVAGTNIEFGTLIVDPLHVDLANLLSITTFETSFLLIPPTIISLILLMKIVSFRSKITIKSNPSGANVLLSMKYEKTKNIPIRPEPELHCLKLVTPCTLMLMDGIYKIKLSSNSYETSRYIMIRDAVETEYTFELSNSEWEYGLEPALSGQDDIILIL